MAKKEVVWTKTAQQQRKIVLEYWLKKTGSSGYSIKLISEVRDRINLISRYPKAGKETDFPNTRFAVMGHYSIFYQIEKTS